MHVMVQRMYSCSQVLLQVLLIPGLLKLPRGNCPQHVIFCTSNPFGIRQWCSARWSRDSELLFTLKAAQCQTFGLVSTSGAGLTPSTFAFYLPWTLLQAHASSLIWSWRPRLDGRTGTHHTRSRFGVCVIYMRLKVYRTFS